MLIFETLFGVAPFYHMNSSVMYNQILTKELTFPDYNKAGFTVSNDALDILKKLLVKSPKARLGGLGDMDEVLSHPFFGKIEKAKMMEKGVC